MSYTHDNTHFWLTIKNNERKNHGLFYHNFPNRAGETEQNNAKIKNNQSPG
jgi:hypothetical protein